MYTLNNIKSFLKKKGYNWVYEYLAAIHTKLTATKFEDVTSKNLSKLFLVEVNGKKQELKVAINEYKFVIYKKTSDNIFANEKEENFSTEWQNFLKKSNSKIIEK